MAKLITLRDDRVPTHLVVLRMGSKTLSDNALRQACERAYAGMGVHAFSVFEVPGHDFEELARLEPILLSRPKMLEASGPDLLAAGFPLLPTAKYLTLVGRAVRTNGRAVHQRSGALPRSVRQPHLEREEELAWPP